MGQTSGQWGLKDAWAGSSAQGELLTSLFLPPFSVKLWCPLSSLVQLLDPPPPTEPELPPQHGGSSVPEAFSVGGLL